MDSLEIFSAKTQVQYQDLIGTAAADRADQNDITEYLLEKN